MKLISFSFIVFLFTSTLSTSAFATAMFKITPVNTNVTVAKGDHAFVSYIIENNIGFATSIKIEPPISPQPTKIANTDCPINSGFLAFGASCTLQITTLYAAQSGTLGSVSVYDASGHIGSKSIEPVQIIVQ